MRAFAGFCMTVAIIAGLFTAIAVIGYLDSPRQDRGSENPSCTYGYDIDCD
jgi:hypothetical protein